jgi:cell division protein FtsA
MFSNYICALDIGSSKISACLVKIKHGQIQSIFLDTVASKGVKGGSIVDSIELVTSMTRVMKQLKDKSGIPIKVIYANISGNDVVTKHSKAIIPLAERGNKIITLSDIQRANEQARILGSSLEEEIIHVVPSGYIIDSKTNTINPLGLYSHRLEADLYLVCAKLSNVQSMSRAVNQSGYEIKDLFLSGLASTSAVFNKDLSEGLTFICDIGSDVTELLSFKNGMLKDLEILKMGGDTLTLALQEDLKIPFELAEEIKKSHGIILGDPGQIPEHKEILLKKEKIYKPVKQRHVTSVITSSAKDLCQQLKTAVEKKVNLYEINNFVVIGRAALLEGLIETIENSLSVPVRLGRINHPALLSVMSQNIPELSGQKYLNYTVCLGIISEVLQGKTTNLLPGHIPHKNPFLRFFNRFKEVYQEYF